MPQSSHIAVILGHTGSMADIGDDVIGGLIGIRRWTKTKTKTDPKEPGVDVPPTPESDSQRSV